MLQHNQDTKTEENIDGGPMCLPGCSNRTYTSRATHLGFTASFITSVVSISTSIAVLALMPNPETRALIFGAMGLVSSVSAGLFYVYGTKKNDDLENDETTRLISPKPKTLSQNV